MFDMQVSKRSMLCTVGLSYCGYAEAKVNQCLMRKGCAAYHRPQLLAALMVVRGVVYM
jgi:hypothetical protein